MARQGGRNENGAADDLSRALMDNVIDGIVVIDRNGTITAFNVASERIFGYSAEEAIGRNVAILMPEDEAAQHDRRIESYIETGEARIIGFGREVLGRRKDGSTFPMDLAVSDMPRGGERYFIGVVRDISDRKQLEEQLRQAYKMEALGQLTGGVAHDFNNLLAVLMMDLEMLAELVEGSAEMAELVEEAREVAKAGADLTGRLLAFSRRQTLQPRAVNLMDEIDKLAPLLRRTLGNQIEIDAVGPGDLWLTMVDPAEFENAILNLAINARDAMPDGGQLTIEASNHPLDDIYIGLSSEVAAGDYVLVSVTDTGTGMPPEVARQAFDPFFTTKDDSTGSGLGLSMVYGFVKQSLGHVAIYSEPGHGTTVNLFIPRASSDSDAAVPAAHAMESEMPRGEGHILLVEDHPQLRARAAATLEGLGYRVTAAANGQAALPHLESADGFDLLFTDVVMPSGMTGPQLATRAREKWPELPVLFTTGYAEQSQLRGGSLPPDSGLIRKPYTKRDLAEKIKGMLSAPR